MTSNSISTIDGTSREDWNNSIVSSSLPVPVVVTSYSDNEMIVINLSQDSNDDYNSNSSRNNIIISSKNNFCLCCPVELIDWYSPYGLLNYNLPWFPTRTSARDWYIDHNNSIRIPDVHKLVPSVLCFLPIVWIHMLVVYPFAEANSILIYIENNQLKLKTHKKSICKETFSTTNDSNVVNSFIQIRTTHQKEIRLYIILSNNERSIKTEWIRYDTITHSKLTFLRDTINNYVNHTMNYSINHELASSVPTIATSATTTTTTTTLASNRNRLQHSSFYIPILADAKIIPIVATPSRENYQSDDKESFCDNEDWGGDSGDDGDFLDDVNSRSSSSIGSVDDDSHFNNRRCDYESNACIPSHAVHVTSQVMTR